MVYKFLSFLLLAGLTGHDVFGQNISIDTALIANDSITAAEIDDALIMDSIVIKGNVYPVLISSNDTIVLADIEDISISSPRKFNSDEDYKRYMRYKYYAAKVYPYAVAAVKAYREVEHETAKMNKKNKKKYIKSREKELTEKFEDPLKNLSKTQGKILVKMIEREIEVPVFSVIKSFKGNFTAFYWNQFSKLYGYRLKDVYKKGENPILDIILQDFDISFDVEANQVVSNNGE